MIESITDISEFVESQRSNVLANFEELLVMKENKIELPVKLNEKYDIRNFDSNRKV